MINKKPVIIGVDVGGTKMLLESFDEQMKRVSHEEIKTKTSSEKAFLEGLKGLISAHFHPGVKAIGIALPGIVNMKQGTLVKAPHLPTKKNIPLRKLLEKTFGVPVLLDNDINAFLLAEKQRPILKKHRNILAIMVGTGVGGAIMIDEKLFYGSHGYAGEVGHMVINASGKRQTLEENAGGYYLEKFGRKGLIEAIGIGLSNLNLIFNPDAIVLGGSVYHYDLSDGKKKLKAIIRKRSLDGNCPVLVDADKRTSVARGMTLECLAFLAQ